MTQKTDIHQQVTDAIIASLESGAANYTQRWLTLGGPAERVTGQRYQGINALLLGLLGQENGFSSAVWMTYNQAKALGGMVRKGEKSAPCTFYKPLEVEDRDTGEPTTVRMLRQYRVFNVDQIDGLPDRFSAPDIGELPVKERNDRAEAALHSCGATIRESDDASAYYAPLSDTVNMPHFRLFASTDDYLATLAHELTHWTGGEDRLNRPQRNEFGSVEYAFEELIAEIGAAFICARLGIAGDHINSHAGYIESWLKALRKDKKLIFKAAALAQTAADMVLANAPEKDAAATAKPVEAKNEAPQLALVF